MIYICVIHIIPVGGVVLYCSTLSILGVGPYLGAKQGISGKNLKKPQNAAFSTKVDTNLLGVKQGTHGNRSI